MLVECCVVWNTYGSTLFIGSRSGLREFMDPEPGTNQIFKKLYQKDRKLTFKVFFCFVNKFASQ